MIRTLYRAATSDVASPAFDPLDPLEGALPTWRIGDAGEPEWLAVVALLGDPFAVRVDVEVVEVAEHALGPDVSGSSRLDEDVEVVDDAPPTRALTLVQPLDVEPLERDEDEEPSTRTDACPDCSAAGLDPCRPKSNPAGRPLTRWHRRRRLLLERDAGRAGWALLLVVAALVAGVVFGVDGVLSSAVDGVTVDPCAAASPPCEVRP